MAAFTISHAAWESCASLKKDVVLAWRGLLSGKAWQRIKKKFEVRFVRSLEVTHGTNGWHPHIHAVFATRALTMEESVELEAFIRKRWINTIDRTRPWPNIEHAYRRAVDFRRVERADTAGDYVTKWGVDSEIAKAHVKKSSKGGRSPWQLLDDAGRGDAQAKRLFSEYASTFKGARHLTWSLGFRDTYLKEPEKSDEDLALQELPHHGDMRIALVSRALWKIIAHFGWRYDVLKIAETRGCNGVAELLSRGGIIWGEDDLRGAPD